MTPYQTHVVALLETGVGVVTVAAAIVILLVAALLVRHI